MAFDYQRYLISVQGGKAYLPVAARLIWFRQERPEWGIETDPVTIDHERQFAVYRATIKNEDGRIIAQATKKEDVKGFGDYIEKAETSAIGRALAMCGFGTQFCDAEFDEGDRLADSPQTVQRQQQQQQHDRRPQNGGGAKDQTICAGCQTTLTQNQATLSLKKFNQLLCPGCQRDASKNGGVVE